MHDRIERVTGVITSVSLVAAALLLAPAFAGLSPSLPLVVVTLALASVALAGRDRLHEGIDATWPTPYLETLWIGPIVAALVEVAFLEVTSAELQTLGAVLGLIGLFNYLLRPVYFMLGSVATRIARAG